MISALMQLLLVSGLSMAAEQTVVHVVKADETAWLVSQIYYGDGKRFGDILKSNHLSSAADLHPGTKLEIHSPKYLPQQPGFNERVEKLMSERSQLLAKKKMNVPVVNEPSKMLESKNQFMESKRSSVPLIQRAKDELQPRRTGNLQSE